MGELAIQLTHSVRGLFADQSRYDNFMAKMPLRYQKLIVYFITFGFVACSVALLGVGCHFWKNITSVEFLNKSTGNFKKLHDGRTENAVWITSMMSALSFFLLLYYCHMRYIMSKYFSNSLRAEKRKINLLFLTFLCAYSVRAVTSYLQRYYTTWVC